MTTSKEQTIEVLGQERRRRWGIEEKLVMVRESLEPGQSVSVMATRNGINPSQLSHWRKLYQGGSLTAVSSGEATDGSNQTNPGSIGSSTAVCAQRCSAGGADKGFDLRLTQLWLPCGWPTDLRGTWITALCRRASSRKGTTAREHDAGSAGQCSAPEDARMSVTAGTN